MQNDGSASLACFGRRPRKRRLRRQCAGANQSVHEYACLRACLRASARVCVPSRSRPSYNQNLERPRDIGGRDTALYVSQNLNIAHYINLEKLPRGRRARAAGRARPPALAAGAPSPCASAAGARADAPSLSEAPHPRAAGSALTDSAGSPVPPRSRGTAALRCRPGPGPRAPPTGGLREG